MTSLALALALSAQIQLRGEFPLQFFFLDEGFGTLDQDLLDTVITALEKLQSHNLAVGVISHVEELKMRLPKKLIVHPGRSKRERDHGLNGINVNVEVITGWQSKPLDYVSCAEGNMSCSQNTT
nr:SbcC/MukB-like Walker B domain-containing protein [Bacillus pumilus]